MNPITRYLSGKSVCHRTLKPAILGLTILLITACGARTAQVTEVDASTTGGGVLAEGGTLNSDSFEANPVEDEEALTEQMVANDQSAAEETEAQLGGGSLGGVALSPSGQYLAAASESGLSLYRADTLEQLWLSASDVPLRCLAWSPDSKYLITGDGLSSSYVWQASDGARLQMLATQARGNSCPVAWSPDGQRVVDGRVIWNTSTWLSEYEFYGVAMGSRWQINAVAWAPDSVRIAFANSTGTISIDDPLNRSTFTTLCPYCGGLVKSLAWSPDGQRLVVANENFRRVEVWDAQSGKIVRTLSKGRSKVAWSPDGGMLAMLSQKLNQVIVVNTSNWAQIRTFGLPFSSVHVSWSPDSRSVVAAGADGSLILWPIDKKTPPVAAPPIVCKNGGSKVYLVVGKERRHIVDWDTFLNLGYKQAQIISCGTLASYPLGAPVTRLLKGSGEPVYWMENGLRRHIPDMATFNSRGFQTKDISVLPDSVLNLWPLGEPLPLAQP